MGSGLSLLFSIVPSNAITSANYPWLGDPSGLPTYVSDYGGTGWAK
jgi:hypothetical protein